MVQHPVAELTKSGKGASWSCDAVASFLPIGRKLPRFGDAAAAAAAAADAATADRARLCGPFADAPKGRKSPVAAARRDAAAAAAAAAEATGARDISAREVAGIR